jgi:hypothetical protein
MQNDKVAFSIQRLFKLFHWQAVWNLISFYQVISSPESFKAFVTDEELAEKTKTKLEVARVGQAERYHAKTVTDAKKALSGPVTEVCSMYFLGICSPWTWLTELLVSDLAQEPYI